MKLFISYSRDDKAWVYELWRDLRDRAFHDAWIDQRLVPAQDWWETILQNIETCECCIYVMTPQSVASIYCRAEVDYAVAMNKPILPLMLKTCDYPDNLRKMHLQYQVIKDDMNLGDVLFIIERAMGEIREGRVMGKYHSSQPSPPRPDEPKPEQTSEQVLEVFMLAEEAASENNISLAERLFQQVAEADPQGYGPAATQRLEEMLYERARQSDYERISQMVNDPTLKRGARTLWTIFVQKYGVGYDPKGLADALREQPPVIESKPKTPEPPIPKEPIPPEVRIQPHEVQQPVKQETNSVKEIVLPPLREAAPVEVPRSKTKTRNGSIIAGLIALVVIVVVFVSNRPSQNQLPSDNTGDQAASAQQTDVARTAAVSDRNTSATLTAEAIPVGSPGHPVTANEQWTPVSQIFSGLEMVRVPVGCFLMGNDPEASDIFSMGVPDGGKQCFNKPFWIDRYEVTNMQYGSDGQFSGKNRPRESVTWTEARDFCASRGSRLPTEAEWEYAARGPDGWKFPWGDQWDAEKAVWDNNAGGTTADVGSKPDGVSWVGAYDMSGNVAEWTSTIYGFYNNTNAQYSSIFSYPYRSADGREQNSNDMKLIRIVRGGSWDNEQNYEITMLHAANRDRLPPDFVYYNFGFRCARSE